MRLFLWKKLILGALASAVLTVGAYVCDVGSAQKAVTDEVLLWSRQLASQASGMAILAKGEGRARPFDWAVEQLSQGEDPRMARVTVIEFESSILSEVFELNKKQGLFEYRRVISPEAKLGVQVKVAVRYFGFLGAKSRIANDFNIAALFLLMFVSFLTVFNLKFREQKIEQKVEQRNDKRPAIRKMLVLIVAALRDTIKTVNKILSAATKLGAYVSAREEAVAMEAEYFRVMEDEAMLLRSSADSAKAAVLSVLVELHKGAADGSSSVQEEAERALALLDEVRRLNQGYLKALRRVVDGREKEHDNLLEVSAQWNAVSGTERELDGVVRQGTEAMQSLVGEFR